MEINITRFFNEAEPFEFSASIAERGDNAGNETWNNAKNEAARLPLLNGENELAAMRQWAKASGGWNDDEIAAWSDTELNALFIQLISGDIREAESGNGEIDWEQYEQEQESGNVSGCLYRGIDGQIYYSLGN